MSLDIEHPAVTLLGLLIGFVGFLFVWLLRVVIIYGVAAIVIIPLTLVLAEVFGFDSLSDVANRVLLIATMIAPLAVAIGVTEYKGDEFTMRGTLRNGWETMRTSIGTYRGAREDAIADAKRRFANADHDELARAASPMNAVKALAFKLHFAVAVLSGPLVAFWGIRRLIADAEGAAFGLALFFGIPILAAWYIWIQWAGSLSAEATIAQSSRAISEDVARERSAAQAGTLTVHTPTEQGELSLSAEAGTLEAHEDDGHDEHVVNEHQAQKDTK